MRGVVVVIMMVFVAATAIFVAGAAVEPLGEHIKTYDTIDDGPLDGTKIIDDVYGVVFKWIPLILVFGMFSWAVAYYLRRKRFTGRLGGGGRP